MTQTEAEDVLVAIRATTFRRYTTVILLVFFALILTQVGIEMPSERPAMKFLAFALGFVSVIQAVFFWRATAVAIELTAQVLRESGPNGRILARVADIEKIDSSAFSYRPASGFLILLKTPAPMMVAPGMWWRRGRKIGIGGVTAKAHSKILAAALQELITERRIGNAP